MAYRYRPPDATPTDSRNLIENEFRLWNEQAGEKVIWDYDLPMQRPGEISAAVRFSLRGATLEVKIDRWEKFSMNLRCCALNIQAMRIMEVRGSLEAMAGTLKALPAPQSPWHTLGLRGEVGEDEARQALALMRSKYHPDNRATGNAEEFKRVGAAWATICSEKGWRE